jgi:uncharacterized protein YdhG (YjbR/CyaY superfamily)
MKKYDNINEYISQFPKGTQEILKKIRETIRKLAKESTETISYGIPTFKLNGNLVHFAAYTNHIGFYPGSKAINIFKKELEKYETSKGTIKFSIDKKIPYGLITKIVRYRVKECSINKIKTIRK